MTDLMFETPILFLIFNRPYSTNLVFSAIRQIKPKYLFVAADGPRKERLEDVEKCKNARAIINNIDWECNIKTLFREQNLGCGIGVSSAINWFFEHVEEGIILEDDCVPHPEFFSFCADMLTKYKSNPRIMSIAGSNFQNEKKRGNASYYYSIHNRIWGWATWKNTWAQYDYNLFNTRETEIYQIIKLLFKSKSERKYWANILINVKNKLIDTWDYQFMFSLWKSEGLTITPNVNLVTNIGYGVDATHTTWVKENPNLYIATSEIYPLSHPNKINRNYRADKYYFCRLINPKKSLLFKLKRRLKKILHITL